MLALLPFLAVLAATPATLQAQLDAAQPGDTVVLTGDVSNLTLKNYVRPADKRVTLNAPDSTLMNTLLQNVSGLTITGARLTAWGHPTAKSNGALVYGYALACYACSHVTLDAVRAKGPESAIVGQITTAADGYGLQLTDGSDLTVTNSTFDGFKVGIVVSHVDGFLIQRNLFEHMRADGIDIAARHGKVLGNFFMATRTLNGEHPDAVQWWSDPAFITSDLEIAFNFVMAHSQGLDGFDHGQGGSDRIDVHDNIVAVDAGQGIGEVAVRSGTTARNHVMGLPGSTVHTGINLSKSPGVTRCENVEEPSAGKKGVIDPPCASPGR